MADTPKVRIALTHIRETVARCGHASVYEALEGQNEAMFATPGRCRPSFARLSQTEALLTAVEASGLHVERFCAGGVRDRRRWAWITDQSQGPREAIPPWAETRGWPPQA